MIGYVMKTGLALFGTRELTMLLKASQKVY